MNRTAIGWIFVAAQAILLIALVVLPRRDDWPTPGWLQALGLTIILGSLAAIGLAALRLGPALTPTPVPIANGQLATTGFYRYVRHPIYAGVLAIASGLALRSGSWVTLAVAATTVVFFNLKAGWEEARLGETYADYAAYASTTPRFVPRPWRMSRLG